MRRIWLPPLAALALGCGNDSGTNPGSYENIAGTYAGAMSGTAQGIVLQAYFTLTITQSAGTLGGSYSIAGTLSDGVNVVSLLGSGTIAGSIAAGTNPNVSITATPGVCPAVRTSFAGSYGSGNHIVTLTGTVPIFDPGTCQVVLSYQNMVLILSR
jgi:hypothetical protein